MLMIKALK